MAILRYNNLINLYLTVNCEYYLIIKLVTKDYTNIFQEDKMYN